MHLGEIETSSINAVALLLCIAIRGETRLRPLSRRKSVAEGITAARDVIGIDVVHSVKSTI